MKVASEHEVLKLLDTLIDVEVQLARYYHVMTYYMPEQGDTWKKLARQETTHGRLLEKIHRTAEAEPEKFAPGQFSEASARMVVNEVDDMRKKILCEEITPQRAISFILDIEDSVFECYASEAVQTESVEANEILEKLKTETDEHRRLLKNLTDG